MELTRQSLRFQFPIRKTTIVTITIKTIITTMANTKAGINTITITTRTMTGITIGTTMVTTVAADITGILVTTWDSPMAVTTDRRIVRSAMRSSTVLDGIIRIAAM